MCLRVARRLASRGVRARVLDLRWLAPLPVDDIVREATRPGACWWPTRPAAAVGSPRACSPRSSTPGFAGAMARVTSMDSFIPLGDAARHVLLSEDTIEQAALQLLR